VSFFICRDCVGGAIEFVTNSPAGPGAAGASYKKVIK